MSGDRERVTADDFKAFPTHPLAWQDHPRFFECGAMNIKHGELFVDTLDGRVGRLDEALHDGDAFVTWSDGTHGTAKWHRFARLDAKEEKG